MKKISIGIDPGKTTGLAIAENGVLQSLESTDFWERNNMENAFICGNCGEVLTATARIENGGCRVVFNINEHTCFGGDQEQGKVPDFAAMTKKEKDRGAR